MSPLSEDKDAPVTPLDESRDVVDSPEPPGDQKKLHKRGKGPIEKRKSSPAISTTDSKMKIGPRSSSQPVLVAFLPQYVNKLKGQPFTLKEKMTRWCKKSPYALIKKHLPPDDFYIEFPNVPYEDKMNDEFGRGLERLAREADEAAKGVTAKPRVEIVLERYPAGMHGITCHFDGAPNNGDRVVSPYGSSGGTPSKASRRSEPHASRSSAPTFDGGNTSRMVNRPSQEGMSKPMPAARRQSLPVLRVPTNTSLLPMGGRGGSQEILDLSEIRHRPSIDMGMSMVARPSMPAMLPLPDEGEFH